MKKTFKMNKETDIQAILADHETRIKKLESSLFPNQNQVLEQTKHFQGLSGGIRFIIKNGFLAQPKRLSEIQKELQRESYYFSTPSVDKILRIDFTREKKILTRIEEDKVWKYIIRK